MMYYEGPGGRGGGGVHYYYLERMKKIRMKWSSIPLLIFEGEK